MSTHRTEYLGFNEKGRDFRVKSMNTHRTCTQEGTMLIGTLPRGSEKKSERRILQKTGADTLKSTLIKDTTKEERIALIKEWIPDDDGLEEDGGIDLWDMYADYINGIREIVEINMSFHEGFYEEEDLQKAPGCGRGTPGR